MLVNSPTRPDGYAEFVFGAARVLQQVIFVKYVILRILYRSRISTPSNSDTMHSLHRGGKGTRVQALRHLAPNAILSNVRIEIAFRSVFVWYLYKRFIPRETLLQPRNGLLLYGAALLSTVGHFAFIPLERLCRGLRTHNRYGAPPVAHKWIIRGWRKTFAKN